MLNLQPTDIYIGLAIVGIFSGIGSSFGQYLFQEIIKPRIHPHIKKMNKKIKVPKEITIKNGRIKIK